MIFAFRQYGMFMSKGGSRSHISEFMVMSYVSGGWGWVTASGELGAVSGASDGKWHS